MIAVGTVTISAELYFKSAHGVPFLFGLIFIWLGWFMFSRYSRWAERANWVLETIPAVPMRISFSETGEGALVADLTPTSAGKHRVILVEAPRWDIRRYAGTAVQVHADPHIDDLVIIRTDSGIIWPLDQHRRIPAALRIDPAGAQHEA